MGAVGPVRPGKGGGQGPGGGPPPPRVSDQSRLPLSLQAALSCLQVSWPLPLALQVLVNSEE